MFDAFFSISVILFIIGLGVFPPVDISKAFFYNQLHIYVNIIYIRNKRFFMYIFPGNFNQKKNQNSAYQNETML